MDSGWELFGDLRAANGFDALKVYDLPENGGNGDGILDARDAIWPRLRLWIDNNHNGISEPWEIFTLSDKGIQAINLDYRPSNRKDAYGNLFRYWSEMTLERDGETRHRRIYDVYLLKE